MRLNRYMTQCPRTDARPARCEGRVQADKIGIAVQPFTVGDDGFLYGDDQPAFDEGPTVRSFWCSEGHSLTEADVLLERNEDTEPDGGHDEGPTCYVCDGVLPAGARFCPPPCGAGPQNPREAA